LAIALAVLATLATMRGDARRTTYVFTPLVDVVPGGAPLTGVEAADLAADAKNKVDARDIQQAFARMGSNISLNDLLEGVEALETSDTPLSPAQKQAIGKILEQARADHDAVWAVQGEILTLESEIDRETADILAALGPEQRARVEAKLTRGGKR
jgi:hypothetical protein